MLRFKKKKQKTKNPKFIDTEIRLVLPEMGMDDRQICMVKDINETYYCNHSAIYTYIK